MKIIPKQNKAIYILCFFLIIQGHTVLSQTVKAMTYNLRYGKANDGENHWDLRKAFLADQIRFNDPDILGIQEGLKFQIDYLDSAFKNLNYVGVGRDDGKEEGEYSALFYNAKKLELISTSHFWLSETPEVPSKGWDASFKRICTYALLEDLNTGQKLLVFNTHFDHEGDVARIKSAQLILDKINEINTGEYPVLFMGDLNLEPETDGIKLISSQLRDSFKYSVEPPFGSVGTFNGFEFCELVTRRIDYIFSNEQIAVQKYAVLTDSKDMHYPSDHFPVIIHFTIAKE